MSDKWEIVALPQGDEIMKNGKVADVCEAERILNCHSELYEALEKMHSIAEFRESANPEVISAGRLLSELLDTKKD